MLAVVTSSNSCCILCCIQLFLNVFFTFGKSLSPYAQASLCDIFTLIQWIELKSPRLSFPLVMPAALCTQTIFRWKTTSDDYRVKVNVQKINPQPLSDIATDFNAQSSTAYLTFWLLWACLHQFILQLPLRSCLNWHFNFIQFNI